MNNSELAVSKTKTVKHIKGGFSHEKYSYNRLFVFDVWDLIESHSDKVLSKTERSHVEYLYKECNNFLVEEARRMSEEQDK